MMRTASRHSGKRQAEDRYSLRDRLPITASWKRGQGALPQPQHGQAWDLPTVRCATAPTDSAHTHHTPSVRLVSQRDSPQLRCCRLLLLRVLLKPAPQCMLLLLLPLALTVASSEARSTSA